MGSQRFWINAGKESSIADVRAGFIEQIGTPRANADRIVECVNAMAGVEKPAEAIETLRKVIANVKTFADHLTSKPITRISCANVGEVLHHYLKSALALFPKGPA